MRRKWIGVVLCAAAALAQTAERSSPQPDYRIAGTVIDVSTGQTLPGERVSLGDTKAGSVPDRSVITGPDGSFAFEHLTAGKYQMYAEAVGYPTQGFDQHEPRFLSAVVVGPGIAADHLAFRLQRGSVISGTISDEFNEPVQHATVHLFRRGWQSGRFETDHIRSAETDDLGHYKLAQLLPATYFIAVSARPWYAREFLTPAAQTSASSQVIENTKRLDVVFPLTFYSGASDADSATPIPMQSGERQTADVVLHSVPAATVRVASSGASQDEKSPRQPPSVYFTQNAFGSEFSPPGQQMRNGPDGATYSSLAPGRYVVHIMDRNGGGKHEEEIDITGDMTIDPDTIGSSAGATITGLAKMSDGSPVQHDLTLLLRKKSRHVLSVAPVEIDDKGQFSVENVPAGTYELDIAGAGDVYLSNMAARNASVKERLLTVEKPSKVELGLVIGQGVGQVHGVALRDAKGVSGVLVLLAPEDLNGTSGLFRRDQSDSDGTFTLPRVVPGKYYVVAIDGAWELEWSKPEVLKRYLAKATTIDVAANKTYEIKVEVQPK